jgi:hypothetical protein
MKKLQFICDDSTEFMVFPSFMKCFGKFDSGSIADGIRKLKQYRPDIRVMVPVIVILPESIGEDQVYLLGLGRFIGQPRSSRPSGVILRMVSLPMAVT